MNVKVFNRMRDNAVKSGWEVVAEVKDKQMEVTFTKDRHVLVMRFYVEGDSLKSTSVKFGRSDIRLNQVRNILENL